MNKVKAGAGVAIRSLAECLAHSTLVGQPGTLVKGLAEHSQKVKRGDAFFSIRGAKDDGDRYLKEVVKKGAAVLVLDRWHPDFKGITQLVVPEVKQALSRLAGYFYGFPSTRLKVVGVTGTNGKTTTTYLIEAVLKEAGKKVGVIGTIAYRLGGKVYQAPNTTPSSLMLQEMMAEMVSRKMSHLVMEVSSHALAQGRVEGCAFEAGVYTNLTQDHLDYHHNMKEYREAKAKLFRMLEEQSQKGARKTAVLNQDDPASVYFQKLCPHARHITYGFHRRAMVRPLQWELPPEGVRFLAKTPWGKQEFHLALVGRFNISNALAAIATGGALGIPLRTMARGLGKVQFVPGRFERVPFKKGIAVIVDFAHTPDALSKLLDTAREMCPGRIITVFGCGGDRDRKKRPLMARVVSTKGDYCVLTSDNPRTEDPKAILREVEKGIVAAARSPKSFEVIVDRKKAVFKALSLACPGDIVLIAGKGHENYQIIGNKRYPYNDKEVVKEYLKRKR